MTNDLYGGVVVSPHRDGAGAAFLEFNCAGADQEISMEIGDRLGGFAAGIEGCDSMLAKGRSGCPQMKEGKDRSADQL